MSVFILGLADIRPDVRDIICGAIRLTSIYENENLKSEQASDVIIKLRAVNCHDMCLTEYVGCMWDEMFSREQMLLFSLSFA